MKNNENTETESEAKADSSQSPCSVVDFNLNYDVSVKLTGLGKTHYVKHHAGYGLQVDSPKEDEDGWWRTQMHNFMNIYGDKTSVGMPMLFDSNVKLHLPNVKDIGGED